MQPPLIWPRAEVTGADLASRLQDVLNRLNNITVGSGSLADAYLAWAADALARLQTAVSTDDLQRLVQTPTFWAVFGRTQGSAAAGQLLMWEIDARRTELQVALSTVELAVLRWTDDTGPCHLVIPDTNVLLHHPEGLRAADWHKMLNDRLRSLDNIRLIVPLLVVDELEKRKEGKEPMRSRARHALKVLYQNFASGIEQRRDLSAPAFPLGGTSVELLLDDLGHVRLPRADDELIRVATRLQTFSGRAVHLVSYDTGAALRATAAAIRHRLLSDGV